MESREYGIEGHSARGYGKYFDQRVYWFSILLKQRKEPQHLYGYLSSLATAFSLGHAQNIGRGKAAFGGWSLCFLQQFQERSAEDVSHDQGSQYTTEGTLKVGVLGHWGVKVRLILEPQKSYVPSVNDRTWSDREQ